MSVVSESEQVERASERERNDASQAGCRGPRQSIKIGFLGYGRVGQAVAALAASSRNRFLDRGVELVPAAALVRDPAKPRVGEPISLATNAAAFFDRRLDVVIEVMGGVHPAFDYVRRALEAGIPVVTANKSLMAAKGDELRAIARKAGVALAYDAAVLAGVPFIGALARRPFAGAPSRITGILNGTSHFLSCALASGRSFDSALGEAIDRGYAEPDSSADVSGRDAAEKLTILAHLAGCHELSPSDLPALGLDALEPVDFLAARDLGGVIKPIATVSFDSANPGAWVGPALVDANHPAALSSGVHNLLEFRHGDHEGLAASSASPVTFAGPGAGPLVTAGTILDDVAEVVLGAWHPPRVSPRLPVRPADLRQPAAGRWYFRARSASLTIEDFAEHLAIHRVPAVRVADVAGSLAAWTVASSWQQAREAADVLTAFGADVLLLPVIEASYGRS